MRKSTQLFCSGKWKPLLGSIVLSVSVLSLSASYSADPDGLKIIDAHTHTAFVGKTLASQLVTVTEADYFKDMKDAGVVGTIAHAARDKKDFDKDLQAKNVT